MNTKDSQKLIITCIDLPPRIELLAPFQACITEICKKRDPQLKKPEQVSDLASLVFKGLIENHEISEYDEAIKIEIYEAEGYLRISFLNRSTPIYVSENFSTENGKILLEQIEKKCLDGIFITFENKLRKGQQAILSFPVKKREHLQIKRKAFSNSEPIYRRLKENEAAKLCRLFHQVYGYNYIEENVYDPERLAHLIKTKNLISNICEIDGEIIGHVGILQRNANPPVYEAALGVIDPRVGSKGIFSKLFKKTIEDIDKIPMQYSVYDFVTNHDLSQKLISKYQTEELAIFVGSQSKETQANMDKLGLGPDPEGMDRYSILLAIRKTMKIPFEAEVVLPVHLGEIADFILEPLGITWRPAPRFFPLAKNGEYETILQPEQKSVLFKFTTPGVKAVKSAADEWSYLLRKGYQYAAAEVSLEHQGIGQMHDLLGRHGFFIAGFIPFEMTNKLGFRFQSLGPTEVAFDKIKVSTEKAKKLLRLIKEDYKRSSIM